jgi:hypothetical protein
MEKKAMGSHVKHGWDTSHCGTPLGSGIIASIFFFHFGSQGGGSTHRGASLVPKGRAAFHTHGG